MYMELKEQVKLEIRDVDHIAITHDSWTSLNNESYDTITAHFINESWELKTRVLQTTKVDGSHTAENIKEVMVATKEAWGFSNDPTVTTDNAANEVKAFGILKWARISCMGHNINLAAKAGLSVPEISRLVAKGRIVVSFFHRSPSATDFLKAKQRLVLAEKFHELSLIQDVATRWNSTVDMLSRLLDLTPAIHAAVIDNDAPKRIKELRTHLFTFEEQALVERIIHVLEPLKKATVFMSSETAVTSHKAIPVAMKLASLLEVQDFDPSAIAKMKDAMKSNLAKRDIEENNQLKLASLLNPETKKLRFLSEEQSATMTKLLIEEAEKVAFASNQSKNHQEDLQETKDPEPSLPTLPLNTSMSVKQEPGTSGVARPTEPCESPPAKVPKMEFEDWLDDVIYVGEQCSEAPTLDSIKEEVGRYLSEPDLGSGGTKLGDLEWWRKREQAYPNISVLAKKYLSIPASSVSSERIFSLAGNIVTKKRCRLSPEMVDMLVFLHKNRKK